ncbi:MAG: hypothetical protein KAR06_08880 [Deltaproteobacteria bacterium]|nr:hypothetical protein [Deltaproteobacteria bacterium]
MKDKIMVGQKRGQLTERIKARSKELLGYEIGQVELRLMVYIQYVMTNEQKIKRECVNPVERDILVKWEDRKFIERRAFFSLTITKEFWDIISEIIYLGYVDLKETSNV